MTRGHFAELSQQNHFFRSPASALREGYPALAVGAVDAGSVSPARCSRKTRTAACHTLRHVIVPKRAQPDHASDNDCHRAVRRSQVFRDSRTVVGRAPIAGGFFHTASPVPKCRGDSFRGCDRGGCNRGGCSTSAAVTSV